LREEGLGLLLARLVSEPVLVLRNCVRADRGDDSLQRHFVRIAEREVCNIPIPPPLGIARMKEEVLDRIECSVRRHRTL
jgi:hypothetical protein